jgi:hypothetical protein
LLFYALRVRMVCYTVDNWGISTVTSSWWNSPKNQYSS